MHSSTPFLIITNECVKLFVWKYLKNRIFDFELSWYYCYKLIAEMYQWWPSNFILRCLWKEFGMREIFLWNFMSCSGSKSTYSSTYLTFWLLDRIIVIILFVPFRTCNFLFEIVKLHDSTYLSNLNTTLQKKHTWR